MECLLFFSCSERGGDKTILGKRYHVLKRLGSGGMGTVYLAEDSRLHMKWAVKELGKKNVFSKSVQMAELSVLRKASHPNLPRITDVFEENGSVFMVMDYIQGSTLEELIRSDKPIPMKSIYQWSIETASALAYLHSCNPPVIYRDLKPSNLIIRPSGSIVLIDFGTAKSYITKKDQYAFGTAKYAAPEQYRGVSDQRSDIYSLGKTMEAMSGKRDSFFFRRILRKCTAPQPEKRFQNAEMLRKALILARDFRRIAAAAAFICVLLFLALLHVRTVVSGSEKEMIKITEEGRAQGLFDDGLLCFYELKDYEAALGYFSRIDGEEIPEAEYYRAFCEEMLSQEPAKERLFELLKEFRSYNEDIPETEDAGRRFRNNINIAQIYLTYGDEDMESLAQAEQILLETVNAYRQGEAASGSGVKALSMLATVYRRMGELQTDRRRDYDLAAVDCLKEVTSIPAAREDPDFVRRRYRECARLYEDLGMLREAEEIYRQSEEEYPGEGGDIYLGHLRLLLKCHAEPETIAGLYREAEKIGELSDNTEFQKIKERMNDYEKENESK